MRNRLGLWLLEEFHEYTLILCRLLLDKICVWNETNSTHKVSQRSINCTKCVVAHTFKTMWFYIFIKISCIIVHNNYNKTAHIITKFTSLLLLFSRVTFYSLELWRQSEAVSRVLTRHSVACTRNDSLLDRRINISCVTSQTYNTHAYLTCTSLTKTQTTTTTDLWPFLNLNKHQTLYNYWLFTTHEILLN